MNVRELSAICGTVVFVIVMTGCVGPAPGKDLDTGVNRDWARNVPLWRTKNPRSIAVISEGSVTHVPKLFSLQKKETSDAEDPTAGRAGRAAAGAVGGGLYTILAGCGAGGPWGCVFGVFVAPVGIAVGAISGATSDPIPTKVEFSVEDIGSLEGAKEVLSVNLIGTDRDPEHLVSQKVAQEIRLLTKHDGQFLPAEHRWKLATPPSPYGGLVRIKVKNFGLLTESSPGVDLDDAPVALLTSVEVDIYSISWTALGFFERKRPKYSSEVSGRWTFLGKSHKYSDLLADDGRLLIEELEKMATNTAIHIVRDIF